MTSDRLELFSRELGEDNAPDLVILHGLLGTSDNWQTLGKRFAEIHRVHLIDQRNHGRSPHHPVHSYEAMAEDLLHYLDERHIQRASIIGHSMGGKTALVFAHRHPDRVHKLVVADMAARAYAPHHGSIFDALQSAPIDSAESRSVVETHLKNRLDDAGVVAFLVDEVPLSMNTLPTLAIYGSKSNYVDASDLDQFQSACMQFQSHEIEGAGHWLHASHPEEFFEEVADFLGADRYWMLVSLSHLR
jgi:pimeloyl-ACP methyl ester carboxylesterase